MRYDGDTNGIGGVGGGSAAERPPPPVPLRTRNTHYRSSSCDVKMMRDDEPKHKRAPPVCGGGHSRNNSRDLCAAGQEFRNKLTHSRNNSSDRHNTNIKYILNYLNTPKLIVPAASLMGGDGSKKHTRNHSYDQIYMPQNIRIDQEFQRRFNKNVSRKNSSVSNADATAAMAGAGAGSGPANAAHSTGTGSKDLNLMNIVLTEDSAGKSVLRHRRTGSRDLNRMGVAPPEPDSMAVVTASSAASSTQSPKHVRQGSQHRIQIDGLETSETIAEADGGAFE